MVYVDGFNLYYAMKSKGWRKYYWLDLRRLSENMLRAHQELAGVRYFTSRLAAHSGDPHKPKRQNIFLEALGTLPDLDIHYGQYFTKQRECFKCGATWDTHEEKMTDVNIAVELLCDAQDDRFDTAIIISADSDLTAPARTVRQRYSDKRVVVAFPPDRHSVHLKEVASATFHIGRKILQDSQLPDQVTKPDGFALHRPAKWH